MKYAKIGANLCLISIVLYGCNYKSCNQGKQQAKLYHCLIDSLLINDTLKIDYEVQACFNLRTENIKFYRHFENLIAEIVVVDKLRDTKATTSNSLTESSKYAYSEFENIGKTYKSNVFSTSHESFTISLKNNTISFENFAPEFDKYRALKDEMFGITKLNELDKIIYKRK